MGAHLLMAAQLIESDPQLAYAHAEAARRRAARLAVTREITGETAYAAGEYAVALHEFKALRRMNGGEEFLAAMADCERALGRPERALKLVREGLAATPDFAQRVELRLVEAGCRLDLDQGEEALRLLRREIEDSAGRGSRSARARLRYGYADVLEQTGDPETAEKWFSAAAALDTDQETDAAERVEALQGVVIEIDEDDLVGGPVPVASEESDESAEGDLLADGDADDAPEADADDEGDDSSEADPQDDDGDDQA